MDNQNLNLMNEQRTTITGLNECEDPELIEINKLIENLDYSNAKTLLEKKIKNEPNNTEAIDTLAEVLLNMDESDSVIKLLKKSINLAPNKNGEKYMMLGQLTDNPREVLKCYQTGVEIFIHDYNLILNNHSSNISHSTSEKFASLKSSIASGYSAIAELYMTSILCNDNNAEEICERSLEEAMKFDPNSYDALIQMSNLRILRKRDTEALNFMDKIYSGILEYQNNGDETFLPSQDILSNLSKNYSELMQYMKAIKILDLILKLNDEDLECWYLLAFNHYTIKNYKYSMKCLKNFKRVSEKHSYKTDEILDLEDAATELYHTLENIRKSSQDGELRNNNIEESEEKDEEERILNNSNADMSIDY